MREIERSTQFKRDYKRELKGLYGRRLAADLARIVEALAADVPLEVRHRDHALRGSFGGYRDWLGSHSELFE